MIQGIPKILLFNLSVSSSQLENRTVFGEKYVFGTEAFQIGRELLDATPAVEEQLSKSFFVLRALLCWFIFLNTSLRLSETVSHSETLSLSQTRLPALLKLPLTTFSFCPPFVCLLKTRKPFSKLLAAGQFHTVHSKCNKQAFLHCRAP